MSLLILGAGGHGQTIADAVLRRRQIGIDDHLIGFLDDNHPPTSDLMAGIPLLGPFEHRHRFPGSKVIIGVGDNSTRMALYKALQSEGFELASIIDPTAVIGHGTTIASGTYIGAMALIGVGCRIGADVIVNGGGCLGHHSQVGDHTHIGPGVHTAREVRIGCEVMVGTGAVIKPETSIGDRASIGAGSVVARDIPAGATAVGHPARPVR